MCGWKGRVGLLLPSTDTTTEPEFWKLAPVDVTVHASRMLVVSVTIEGLFEIDQQTLCTARAVASAGVDLIGFCCTAGSFVQDPTRDPEVAREEEGKAHD